MPCDTSQTASIIFLCHMLVLHQFIYVLLMIRCTFIHFPALTYYTDATMPVPCFVFQKSCTGNILRIGENKSRSSYFTVTKTKSRGETERHHRATTPCHGAGPPLAAPWVGVAALWRPLRLSSGLRLHYGKI